MNRSTGIDGRRMVPALLIPAALVVFLAGQPVLSAEAQKDSTSAKSAGDSTKDAGIVTGGLEIDATSAYMWHGLPLSHGFVLEPWPWVSVLGFTLSGWGNMPVTNKDDRPWSFDEAEVILDYEYEWNNLSFAPSLVFYLYPSEERSAEITLGLAYGIGEGVGVSTRHSFDVWNYAGSYFGELGISYEREFLDRLSLEASAGAGWGSPDFNSNYEVEDTTVVDAPEVDHWALNVLLVDARLTWTPVAFLYVAPHIGLAVTLDRDLQDALRLSGYSPVTVHGGVAFGAEF